MATNYSFGNPALTQQKPNTFSELQKQGVARPPSPTYQAPAPQQPAPQSPTKFQPVGSQALPEMTGAMGGAAKPPVQTAVPFTGQRIVETADQMGGGQKQQQQPPTHGNQDIGQQLMNQWQNRTPAQQFVPGQNPWMNQTNNNLGQQINNAINNPSPYSSEAYRQNYDYSRGLINQDFQNQNRQLQEQMARMGFGQSTLAGQRYSDLGTEQARALTGMNVGLLNHMADTYGADRNAAFNAGMGYSGQLYGQDLNTFNANQNAQNQWYNQGNQDLQNLLGYGQQQWQNQYATNQFNAQQQQYNDQMLLAMLGYTG